MFGAMVHGARVRRCESVRFDGARCVGETVLGYSVLLGLRVLGETVLGALVIWWEGTRCDGARCVGETVRRRSVRGCS
jgi:hypothetical protein